MKIKLKNIILILLYILNCSSTSEDITINSVKNESIPPVSDYKNQEEVNSEIKENKQTALFDFISNGIKKEDLYFIGEPGCLKSCESENLFFQAFFNSNENDIVNNIAYEGNEFSFNKDKPKFEGIMKKKYFLIKYLRTPSPNIYTPQSGYLEFSNYDFKRKGYNINFFIGNMMGHDGKKYVSSLESDDFFISLPEDKAEEIKKELDVANYYILFSIKKINLRKPDFQSCNKNFSGYQYYKSKIDIENDAARSIFYTSCKPIFKKVKVIEISIKKIIAFDNENNRLH